MKPSRPDDPAPEDEGFTISAADVTSRIKVDPWTGEVIPEFPPKPPSRPLIRPLVRPDPDRTHEVEIDPVTGRVITARKIGPRLLFGPRGPSAPELSTLEIPKTPSDPGVASPAPEFVLETTLEVDTRSFHSLLAVEPDPPGRPVEPEPELASAQSEPPPPSAPPPVPRASAPPPVPRASAPPPVPRASAPPPPVESGQPPSSDDLAPGAFEQPMPPPVTRASTPPSPADQSYVASLSATEPWTHIGLGPEGSVAGARTTLGLKVVVAVALAALFMGASIGIALTFLVIDEDEPKRDVEATVLRPPVAPGPNDAGQAPAEGPGPDDVPTPAHSSSEPDPVATAPPAKQGAGDQVVLPITFPRNGSDPENVDTEQIRQIANLMLQDKRMKVDVVGFAGPDEDVETAERVSARRAKIAVSLLSACGPSRSRFSYQSGGTSAELGRKAVFRVRTE